jgi:uncharacterized protein HemX
MLRAAIALAVLIAVGVGGGGNGFARTASEGAHPTGVQVDGRLAIQNARIRREQRAAEISRERAYRLHQQANRIRAAERDVASRNGGHIASEEPIYLNGR